MRANKNSQNTVSREAALLGGPKVLGMNPRSPLDWVFLVRQGIPSSTLDSLGANVAASNADIAEMLGISTRALAGRRRKNVLSRGESERWLRVVRVMVRLEEVFDDLRCGFAWLRTPNNSLGGSLPISLLDTCVGAECVMETLGRIEHGVFA